MGRRFRLPLLSLRTNNQRPRRFRECVRLRRREPLFPEHGVVLFECVRIALLGGVRFVGSRAGDPANTIEVPAYTLLDASARYLWQKIELQLSATNLTDKTYVAVCTSASYCNYGSARKVIATARYHF